jgi:hypothetical protein
MGSLKKCIPGYVPSDRAKAIRDRAAKWEDTFGDLVNGKARAELAAVDEEIRLIAKRRQQVALSALKSEDLRAAIEKGGKNPGAAFAARLVRDYLGKGSDEINAESMQHVVRTQAHVKAAPLMDLAAATPGRNVEAVSDDILRALSGQNVANPAAKEAAGAWTQAAEWLKAEFNRLGGDIKTRGDWMLPQVWDREKVFPRSLGEDEAREAFVDDLLRLYAEPERMHPIMGKDGAPLVSGELRAALADIADGIRVGNTQGTIGVVPGAVGNRHLDPRVIGFRNVEDRIEFAKKYGNPNAFEVMDQHVETLSREIGLMRVLGPHPDRAYAEARQLVAERGYGGRGLGDEAKLAALDSTYLSLSGALSRPASIGTATVAGSARSFLSAGLLPLSIASQLSDVMPVSLAAAFNGLPVMKTIGEGLKALKPLAKTDRGALVRLGVDLDGMAAQLAQSGILESSSRSRWLAETTLRWNGTRKWTEAWYSTMQRQMMGRMADVRGLDLAAADEAMNGALSRYGWTPASWDRLREHGIFEHDGAAWASVDAIERSPLAESVRNELVSRLIHTVQTEGRIAMTVPDARVRAAMGGGMQVGTVGGEAARFLTQFKSFGSQFALNSIGRLLSPEMAGRRFKYGTALIAGTTALGMLSLQVKRLLKGQGLAETDPTTEEGRKTWLAAVFQGGGVGILGDLAGSAFGQNRFGQSPLSSLAGPGVGAAGDVLNLTFGNAGQILRGEDTNTASEAVKLAGRYAPLVNLPYLGIATQRLVIDQLRLMADPSGTRRSFMSTEQRQRQEFGSKFWWRPGQTSPEFLR